MKIVVVTGEIAGRRVAARTVAERGYNPIEFLVEMAGRGWRWRFERLEDESTEVQRAWQADPDRFAEQITEIDTAIGDSGRHVFALTEPPYNPAEPGDLVIGMGAPG